MQPLTYLLLRLGIGASMFGHGLVRIPKLSAFSGGMVGEFEGSMLPAFFVRAFGYALPFIELIVGALVLIGFFTRWASFIGGLTMVALILGCCLIENWGAIPSQMIHLAFFAILLQFPSSNRYSLDERRRGGLRK